MPPHVLEQLVLEPTLPFVGTQDLGLVFLQLLGDEPLAGGQRLAAHVVVRHTLGLGARNLDAIPEHTVEAHAKPRQARAPTLTFLEAGDPGPRLAGVLHDGAQGVAPALADETAVVEDERWLIHESRLQHLPKGVSRLICASGIRQARYRRVGYRLAHGREHSQRRPQSDQISGVSSAEGGPAGQALEVAETTESAAESSADGRVLDERTHAILTRFDGGRIDAAAGVATGATDGHPSGSR